MQDSEYVEQVGRTESVDMGPIKERLSNPDTLETLAATINAQIALAQMMDNLKKHIFYGKPLKPVEQSSTEMMVSVERLTEENTIRHLHAVMGMETEVGEMMESLKKYLGGADLDGVNVLEELGDVLWYATIPCRVFGFTMEAVKERNIAKLRARYGEKFTAERALNRDLTTEREILEGKK